MNDWWQWSLCSLLGLWATGLLVRHFGWWPQDRSSAKPDEGCGSGCAHCEVAKATSAAAEPAPPIGPSTLPH